MLIVKNKRYVRKHVVGGAGIFDTVSNFFKRLPSSSGVSLISKAAATDIGKHAINAAKTVGKELATSAISTAKDIAIDKGKQLIAKARPEPRPELTHETSSLTQESKEILANLVRRIAQPASTETTSETTNLNRLLAGQGLKTNRPNCVSHKTNKTNKTNSSKAVKIQPAKAVRIQDMVRALNGGGLRLA